MADQNPNQNRPDRILGLEVPGDTDSADIVDRTGEQMPRQSHDGLEADDRERDANSTRVNDEDRDTVRDDPRPETNSDRHDNPRTGRISDY